MTPPVTPDPASVLADACRELARLPGVLEAMLARLDDALWRARPAPREWSPVEIASPPGSPEHHAKILAQP